MYYVVVIYQSYIQVAVVALLALLAVFDFHSIVLTFSTKSADRLSDRLFVKQNKTTKNSNPLPNQTRNKQNPCS